MEDRAISGYARRLRRGVLAAYVLTLLLVVFGHLGLRIGNVPVMLQSRVATVTGQNWVGDAVLVIIGMAIYWLSEALRGIARGELFSHAVVRRFRLFASWMLIAALVYALAPTLLATLSARAGGHRLPILVDVRDLLMIGLTLVILLIARMFERARMIEDEMREFV